MRQMDLTGVVWRKSSRSNQQGGACVEVSVTATRTAVRDSKNPTGPTFTVPAAAWTAFRAAFD